MTAMKRLLYHNLFLPADQLLSVGCNVTVIRYRGCLDPSGTPWNTPRPGRS